MIYRLQKERMVGQRRSYFALILLYLRAPSLFGSTFSKSHIFGAISGFLPQLKKL
jgi:hypothetical protein